ncbi:hypothetical protein PR202_gb14120 [Eleusine coracana subsp. coracana]|uniref:STAS domain-containing protein n=1 Tax=Eleusine coracana subsp. coracana TaxID=191504 RepID=A0AAV5ETP8_ELECO|nr:hypothetical protein PR202_gb14120 [Eleusine coracana subsp. coracana]
MRACRLGFIIDFLSKATLVGFMAGAAIIVSLQQLKAMMGIVHFTTEMGIVPVMASVFHHTKEWSWQTILMGVCFLVFLLAARHVSLKWPRLFWVSACAPLASVIISTLVVFLFKAENHGISIIGQLKCGLNRPSWDKLLFDTTYLGLTMKTGLVTGIISLTGLPSRWNKEMMAIGLMNVVGSCTSCYITTGAFSRSAVNHNAGCKTAMSNVIMALTVMITLLFLMPLFVYTPNVVLGAIIIAAVIGLIDIPAVYHIWKMDKMDFLVCVCAFVGVIFISVQEGLAIAVGISIFRVLLQITRPKIMVQGNIRGTDNYRSLHQYKDAQRIPGFLILATEAPINFANSNYLNERIKRWIEEESSAQNKQAQLRFIILDLSGVPAIDTSGVAFLIDIKKSIEKRGLECSSIQDQVSHEFLGIAPALPLTATRAAVATPHRRTATTPQPAPMSSEQATTKQNDCKEDSNRASLLRDGLTSSVCADGSNDLVSSTHADGLDHPSSARTSLGGVMVTSPSTAARAEP